MKQSGCEVPEWMLTLQKKKKKNRRRDTAPPKRPQIDTTPSYDKIKRHKRKQSIQQSKRKKKKAETSTQD